MYDKSFEQYFRPRGVAPLANEVVSAAAAVHGGYVCVKKCCIKRVMFVVELAILADTTLPVLEFNKRPVTGSAAGETVVATVTLPSLTAAGQVLYKDIDPVEFLPGQELSLELLTQGVHGAGAAGNGYYGFEIEDSPEDARNLSSMVQSV